jgi:hypothetical protein
VFLARRDVNELAVRELGFILMPLAFFGAIEMDNPMEIGLVLACGRLNGPDYSKNALFVGIWALFFRHYLLVVDPLKNQPAVLGDKMLDQLAIEILGLESILRLPPVRERNFAPDIVEHAHG